MSAQEYIGSVEFQLHQVVTALNQTYATDIKNTTRKNNGKLHIVGEEKKQVAGENALITLEGQVNSSNDVFFIIWKFMTPGKYKPVYKSENRPKGR